MNSRLGKILGVIVLALCVLPAWAHRHPLPKPAPRSAAASVSAVQAPAAAAPDRDAPDRDAPDRDAKDGSARDGAAKDGGGQGVAASPKSGETSQTGGDTFAPEHFAQVNLAADAGVIELKRQLQRQGAMPENKSGGEASLWYVFTAVNASNLPAIRILQAGQPTDAGLRLIPMPARPEVLQLVSTNPNAVIEKAADYGARAFRISLPPHAYAVVAVRMQGAETPPSLMAWTEPALAAHNRWMAIFVATVAGLIAAAAALAGGMAVMTRQLAPRLAALLLVSLFLMRMSATGLFDGMLATPVGGPYGLTALFTGLALAAGIRLINVLLPVGKFRPWADRRLKQTVYGIGAVAVLAYLGLPGGTLAVHTLAVLGAIVLAVYVVFCWRRGMSAARALAPAAALFALYGLAAAYVSLGGLGLEEMAPDISGAFLATGSMILVLALVTGEGAGLMGMRHIPAPVLVSAAPPVPHAAIEAIGASFQGVFELDIVKDTVMLSREAAALFGLGLRVHNVRGAAWRARLHPDDRLVYEKAIADFRSETEYAFRIEFRARDESGRYLWFELRATMKGPPEGPAERCVGLLADVTMRKEAEAEAQDRSLRDPLTGLGNRVALMKLLDGLGVRMKGIVYALVDIDGYRDLRSRMGDACCEALLMRMAERLDKHFRASARVFRVGGDAFAILLECGRCDLASLGGDMAKFCAEPYVIDGQSLAVTVSIGIAEGRTARDPLALINNAEVALRLAQCQGGDCARLFAAGMETLAPSETEEMAPALREALEREEIDILYRPILRLHDRTVAGFEAVLRWHHPRRGTVAPCDLMCHSEDLELLTALNQYGLRQAQADLVEWQRYFPLSEPLFVALQVPQRLWASEEFSAGFTEDLQLAATAPASLVLEMVGISSVKPANIAGLSRLRASGVSLALCDFSGDLPPIEDLKSLPFDMVKIDKSFLTRQSGERVTALVASARKSRCRVIVEMVESEDEAAYVAKLGCELAQGRLFSLPMSREATLKYIARYFRPADSEISA